MVSDQKKNIKSTVMYHEDAVAQHSGSGVTRAILAYNADMMAVELTFKQGAIGALHQHPHTQCTYVLRGKFRYQIENDYIELNPGDSIIVSSDQRHGTLCIESGSLLDIFTPAREDMLN